MNYGESIVGISSEPSVVPLRLVGLAAGPESLDAVLRALADADVQLRSIVRTDDQLRDDGVIRDAAVGPQAAPVSVVGSRLHERLAIAARMFRALSREGINSECLSTSEARIWCLVGDSDRQRALGALREEFVEELSWLAGG